MSRDEILAVVKRKGSFEVSWRWRDDALRRQCMRMVRAGILARKSSAAGSDVFVARAKGEPK